MKLAIHLVYALLQAAAVGALATGSGPSFSSTASNASSSHLYSGSDSDDSIDNGFQLLPPPPPKQPLIGDNELTNVTLKFFIIFVSVCAGAGVVAFTVILCAYCRESKLLETSDDSDTESVYSCTTSETTITGDSDSLHEEIPAYATPPQRHIPLPPIANKITAHMACEDEEDTTDLSVPVIQVDTQSNELNEFLLFPPETTFNLTDDAATAIPRSDSRLSLSRGRRGVYEK